MPRGDGSGPNGMGPMTGRGAGYCVEEPNTYYRNSRLGMGRGLGRGFGFRRNYRPFNSGLNNFDRVQNDERAFLENQVETLGRQIEQMQQKLDELNKK